MKKNIKTNLKRWLLWRVQSNEFYHIAGANPERALDQVFYRQFSSLQITEKLSTDMYRVSGPVKTYLLTVDDEKIHKN